LTALLISNSDFSAIERWLIDDYGTPGASVDRHFDLLPDTSKALIEHGMVHVRGNKEDTLILTIKGRRYLRDLVGFEIPDD